MPSECTEYESERRPDARARTVPIVGMHSGARIIMLEMEPVFIVEARGIRKSFGPSEVLKGAELSVAAGEVHALLGGNGAGKSTLIKILTSTLRRDAGTISFRGYDIDTRRGEQEMSRGIAVVHQEMALLPDLTVEENIDLPHRRRAMSLVNNGAARRVAVEALSLIDPRFAKSSTNRLVSQLTLHERQLTEIARALSAGAQLLLLDEPTANLTSTETGKLFECLRRLVGESGISIVFVSHRMKEIREIADVCTILRDGVSAINRAAINELTDREIIVAMGLAQAFSTKSIDGPSSAPRTAATKPGCFRIEGPQLDLTFEAGDIIGLAGAPAGPLAGC
jgi:ribose transport system ATP-binding protein